MARIRTIKPEFWTDEKVVQLPYEARLLFIGLWNFADDDGYLPDEPDRIQLQVLPADQVDCDLLLDLLVAADLLEKLDLSDGRTALRISGFDRHQKISHKTPTKLPIAGAKKRSVSTPVRRDIALKYGCKPGEVLEVSCYYCGSPGSIHWFRLRNGRPSSWVAFGGMEIDHFTPESDGGATNAENLVLSCRYCNRSKGTKDGVAFLSKSLPSAPENSGTFSPDLGRELKGRESSMGCEQPEPIDQLKAVYPKRAGSHRWTDAKNAIKARQREGHTLDEILDGARRYADWCKSGGKAGTEYVMQAATFVGANKQFLEEWDVQATNGTARNAVFEQPHERRARELREYAEQAEGGESVDAPSGNPRGQVLEGVWEPAE